MTVKAENYTDDPTTLDLITRLFDAGEHVPDELYSELLAADEQLDAALVAILADAETASSDAPGRGWAPLHAASLAAARHIDQSLQIAS